MLGYKNADFLFPHQYALVDIAVVATLHTDSDDAGVSDLLVVDRQQRLLRAGRR